MGDLDSRSNIQIVSSLTLEISPTRYRVPDVSIFSARPPDEGRAITTAPLIVIEVLSPEDTLMYLEDLEGDYRRMGVTHIWFLDPRSKIGCVCTPAGWFRTGTFTVPGTPISLNLADF
jgi:Uma2 family endonuclease